MSWGCCAGHRIQSRGQKEALSQARRYARRGRQAMAIAKQAQIAAMKSSDPRLQNASEDGIVGKEHIFIFDLVHVSTGSNS